MVNPKKRLLKEIRKSKKKRTLFHFFLWILGFYKEEKNPPAKDFVYPNPKQHIDENQPTVTWINHSTFLIKINSILLLTDPIWSERCSPFKKIGPKRQFLPPFPLQDLSKVNLVLISHNHYDHLDYPTVKQLYQLNPSITWIVPLGVKKWFLRKFPSIEKDKVTELFWNENYKLDLGSFQLEITSVPAKHFSGRGLHDQNKTLWMGVIVHFYKNGNKWKSLYFAGDTGYHEQYFKQIGLNYGPFDLSLIPIGVYSPREFMSPVHVHPEESATIHQEVGSKLSIGGHHSTFKLSDEDLKQPPYDLYLSLQKKGIDVHTFRVLEPGQSINW